MHNGYPLIAIVLAYLLGSVSFAVLVSRAMGLADPRSYGSHNPGATNVLRTGNKKIAAATLLLDGLKGTVAVLVAQRWGADFGLVAGLGAFLGHLFPVWLRFAGGKGVATFIGILAAIYWPAFFAFAAIWIAMAYLFRFSSLAALTASLAMPALFFATGQRGLALSAVVAMVFLLFAKHHENISRLIAGTESRIGQKG